MAERDCDLCQIVSGEKPAMTFFEYGTFKAILAKQPTLLGHSIIFPNRHGAINFTDLTTAEKTDFQHVWGLVEIALLEILKKDRSVNSKTGGFIRDHFHLHIYPLEYNAPWNTITELFENRYCGSTTPNAETQLLLQLRNRFNYAPRSNQPTR